MSDDLLARAARALREETAGDDASARFTRSRIMASVHDERVKRRTRWAFVIPIAATFVAASAYGAATGKTREVLQVITHALGIHHAEPAPPPEPPARRRTTAPRVAPAPPPPPAPLPSGTEAALEPPAPPVEPIAGAASPAPLALPKTARPGAVESLAAAAPARSLPDAGDAAADPTFELYRAAHRAHFVGRDYGRALGAWDAYLKAAPNGALAPEARYNRALCFVHLHRSEEARVALRPFAEGRYGTYRREDAQKLLDALPAGPVGP